MAWYNEVANNFMDYIANPINEGIKSWLGVSADERAKESLAIQNEAQQFNEQYSKEQLKQQAEQFSQSNATALKNIAMQEDVAKQNLAFQQDAFNRQLQENELTRQREDSAYQRQIADLKAAGFSPLMASNGASASGMSVGSAPQLDYSGVASAQGSQLTLAQEYASLKNMAEGQYLTRRQEIANARSSALQVLSDLSRQRQAQGLNLALQSFNMATQLKDMKKKHELIDEQIRTSKNTNAWMEEHGYRNQNEWSILLPILDKLANNIGLDYDKLGEAFSNMPQTIINSINDLDSLYDGTENGFIKLKSKVEVLKGADITKNSFDNLLNQLIEPTSVSNTQIETWYNSMNEAFKDKFSYDYFYDAVIGKSKWKKSVLLKYLTFGNGGNI